MNDPAGDRSRGPRAVSDAALEAPHAPAIVPVRRGVERFDHPFLRVRVDEVRFPDGRPGSHVVIEEGEVPCGALVIARTGRPGAWRYGLTVQFRYPIGESTYEFVTGGTANDSAEEAARELREELGVEPISMRRLGTVHADMSKSAQYGHVWLAVTASESPAGHVDTENGAGTRWVTEHQLVELIRAGGITHASTLSAWALLTAHGL